MLSGSRSATRILLGISFTCVARKCIGFRQLVSRITETGDDLDGPGYSTIASAYC